MATYKIEKTDIAASNIESVGRLERDQSKFWLELTTASGSVYRKKFPTLEALNAERDTVKALMI